MNNWKKRMIESNRSLNTQMILFPFLEFKTPRGRQTLDNFTESKGTCSWFYEVLHQQVLDIQSPSESINVSRAC